MNMEYEFKFPDIGEGIHEGKVLEFKFGIGDFVKTGDVLAVVETDKVVADIPSPKDGILTKWGVGEGEEIVVGATLAYIETGVTAGAAATKVAPSSAPSIGKAVEEDNAGVVGRLETAGNSDIMPASNEGSFAKTEKKVEKVEVEVEAKKVTSSHATTAVKDNRPRGKVQATPLARKLAHDGHLDISALEGTGPGGRVCKKDVLEALENGGGVAQAKSDQLPVSSPASSHQTNPSTKGPAAGNTVTTLSMLRKTVAKNMEIGHSIPTASLQEFCILDEIVKMREQINSERGGDAKAAANGPSKISFQHIFIKALALTLKKYPQLNATFNSEKSELTQHGEVNIGIAVETPKGLMVPVLKNVGAKTIDEIATSMQDLVVRGKAGTLSLEDLRGGTFTITNFGPFGGTFGAPILLAPQVGIMGTGRIHQAPVVVKGQVVAAWVLPLSFVFDHRVVDGAPASIFLTHFRKLLESPYQLMMSMS
jgi:pyruvate dehydrogenase E2 component (dihydrolipoamide acetyltransferase)